MVQEYQGDSVLSTKQQCSGVSRSVSNKVQGTCGPQDHLNFCIASLAPLHSSKNDLNR